jgi:hypothetical protein
MLQVKAQRTCIMHISWTPIHRFCETEATAFARHIHVLVRKLPNSDFVSKGCPKQTSQTGIDTVHECEKKKDNNAVNHISICFNYSRRVSSQPPCSVRCSSTRRLQSSRPCPSASFHWLSTKPTFSFRSSVSRLSSSALMAFIS